MSLFSIKKTTAIRKAWPMFYNDREVTMINVLEQLKAKKITSKQATDALGVSRQTVWRRNKKYLASGRNSVFHGNKGKESKSKIDAATWQRIDTLLATDLQGMGPAHATEKLNALYSIDVSAESIRKYMHQKGLMMHCRKPRKPYRSKRPRKMYRGQLVQMDGSYFAWFKHDPERYCIIALIDDANSEITTLWFCQNETTLDALMSLKKHIESYDIPLALYTDKHSSYRMIDRAAFERGELCDFQKACKKLGIQNIYANSPQAKGRVERLFRFLQDRLPHELALMGIATIEQANQREAEIRALMNKSYAKKPLFSETKSRPASLYNVHEFLTCNETRVLQNDWTFTLNSDHYQVLKDQPIKLAPKDLITIRTYPDKTIKYLCKGEEIRVVPIIDFNQQKPVGRPLHIPKRIQRTIARLNSYEPPIHYKQPKM